MMSRERYRECLDAIGWTDHFVATRLGVHETRTRRWGKPGREDIPRRVEVWLERLTAAHDADPLPEGWDDPDQSRSATSEFGCRKA